MTLWIKSKLISLRIGVMTNGLAAASHFLVFKIQKAMKE